MEKIARLIGYEYSHEGKNGNHWVNKPNEYESDTFNPLTNKSDLMDVENAFYTTLMNILPSRIEFWGAIGGEHSEITVYIDDYPDKFTARAHAVCAVAEKIYDRKHNEQNTD